MAYWGIGFFALTAAIFIVPDCFGCCTHIACGERGEYCLVVSPDELIDLITYHAVTEFLALANSRIPSALSSRPSPLFWTSLNGELSTVTAGQDCRSVTFDRISTDEVLVTTVLAGRDGHRRNR